MSAILGRNSSKKILKLSVVKNIGDEPPTAADDGFNLKVFKRSKNCFYTDSAKSKDKRMNLSNSHYYLTC